MRQETQSGQLVTTKAQVQHRADTSASKLLEAWLTGRSPHTLDAYQRDLESFKVYSGAFSVPHALELLTNSTHGAANRVARGWRNEMRDEGLAPATVNRRLAALRSVVKLARTFGLVSWALEVPSLRSQPYRDTKGPGRDGFAQLLRELDKRGDEPKAIRDRAALRLLYDCALRRSEVVGLDVGDVDLAESRVFVRGKGRDERAPVTLPRYTREALAPWLEVLAETSGPVFVSLDRRAGGSRLWPASLTRIVRQLSRAAGVPTSPHGLRHSAITEALTATGGNVRDVQRFSRHVDIRTVLIYDDNREDAGGTVAELVATRAGQ